MIHDSQQPSRLPQLVQQIGAWTNRNMGNIARIPGAFSLFRLIYKALYPISQVDVDFGKTLPRRQGGAIARLLIIVPQSWHSSGGTWKPAAGNYFFDIWQSAVERYGEKNVFLHEVAPSDGAWQQTALDAIRQTNPSHIVMQGEEDPNGDPFALTNFAAGLAKFWDGQLIFVMYDSVYWWHIFKAENVARLYPQTSVHAIDRFPRELRRVLHRTGPGVLPTSLKTMDVLRKSTPWQDVQTDTSRLTFVGSLYPDRLKQLKKYADYAIDVHVNPHREGRTDRPTYEEYSAAIRHSWGTVNLSRNHGMPSKHVKTRVLEAPLFGTVLFSDEKRLSSLMVPVDAFVYFKNKKDLARKIAYYRGHPDEFDALKERGLARATEIGASIFWTVIESGVVGSGAKN
jgi:hypothetical protein